MHIRAYLRASTKEQDARRAKKDLEAFCRERGLKIASTYVENESGASLQRPELFVGAFTEKLLTFALGRGLELSDAPAVRKIVREARSDHYRLSSIVLGIAGSTPFQMRKAL